MTLADLMERLDSLDDGLTIYADKNPAWSADSPAAVYLEPEDGRAAEGMSYLLEVELAKDVVRTLSGWRDGREPTTLEKCEAVIYYAEHDAFPPE